MTAPDNGNYKIVAIQETAKSAKVTLQSLDDSFSDPIQGIYASQRYLAHRVEVGAEGTAQFEAVQPDPSKKGDRGYVKMKVWTPIGGMQPPVPALRSPAPTQVHHLDAKDRSIIAQTCLKVAGEVIAATGAEGDVGDAVLDLADKLYKGVREIQSS